MVELFAMEYMTALGMTMVLLFLDSRYSPRRTIGAVCGTMVLVMAAVAAIYQAAGLEITLRIYSLIAHLPSLLLLLALSRFRGWRLVFQLLSAILFCVLVQHGAGLLYYLSGSRFWVLVLSYAVLSAAVVWFLVRFLRPLFLQTLLELRRGWWLICLVMVVYYVTVVYLIPGYALLDPELIMTVPAKIAAACGVDAFVHAEEAYVSKMANPFTDAMAEKAMELIGGNIRQFVASRDNEEAACNMMLGSTLAGIAFAWAKLGDVHAMSHPVSGFFGVAHGVANAILLPAIVEFNALADNGRYRKIYNYITNGKKADDSFVPQMLVDELRKLNCELGIPAKLSDVGVTEDKIPEMVADTMKSGNVLVNPRQTTPKDVEALYRSLL